MFKKQKINESDVLKYGFLGGIAQAGYTLFVVLGINVLHNVLPQPLGGIFDPILFLLLFVFSAAVSAILVFGYPLYLATEKRYAESIMTVTTTLVTLAIIGILFFIFVSFI
ncbi:MAG: hypothetical protein CMI53_05070 [Parcubacteria group bacterium]|jgi:hypothetical protein|nr:hypothetical protein [Parcubacteria group bacterium]|tara:strand:+ start:3998 stop:4330 length:333 start_codon:yes stop_codon:yes gene_type:complete